MRHVVTLSLALSLSSLAAGCGEATPLRDAGAMDAAAPGTDSAVATDSGTDGAATPDAGPGADPGGGGRYLIFNRNESGHKHLFRSDFDGSNIMQLTSGDHDNVYPHIAGSTVYFSSGGRGGSTAISIFRMELDGSGVRVIPIELPSAHMFMPSLCGSYLFFTAFRPGVHDHLDVYRVDADGGVPIRITTTTNGSSHGMWAAQPSCNPAQDRVGFSWTQSGNTQIWSAALDGSDPVQLTFVGERNPSEMCLDFMGVNVPCYSHCNAPHWGSDGSITMFCGIERHHGEIFRMNADGTGQLQLTDDPATLSNDGPTFSPDATHVVYTHGDDVARITTLERVRADGANRETVILGVGAEFTSTWGG